MAPGERNILRPSLTLYVKPLKSYDFAQLEPIRGQLRIFEFESLFYFNLWVISDIPGCRDLFSNNAITLFTSKRLIIKDLANLASP